MRISVGIVECSKGVERTQRGIHHKATENTRGTQEFRSEYRIQNTEYRIQNYRNRESVLATGSDADC